MDSFIRIIISIIVLFFSIIIHEVSHGYMALVRGDPTARDAGRLTLNPIPHIDIFGTIILPLLLIIMRSSILFAWAKPVPINPYNFQNSKKDTMLVGAAGPLSNIGLAIVFAILFRVFGATFVGQFLLFGVAINLILAFFNLVPIPPLDGSRILQGFLSYEAAQKYMVIERFGFIIIYFLLFAGLFQHILLPIVSFFLRLLTGIGFGGL